MPNPDQHDDDAIGFSSPQSLQGASRPAASVATAAPAVTVRDRLAARQAEHSPPASMDPSVLRGLYTRYVLILCAVPTLGVSALVGLLAVIGRNGRPDDRFAHGHFVYQKRTLVIAAITAVIGVVGIAVPIVPVGVIILFALTIWIIVRGASGFIRLQDGKPISNPRSWWI